MGSRREKPLRHGFGAQSPRCAVIRIAEALRVSGIAAVDARVLLRFVLGWGDAHLAARPEQVLTEDQQDRYFSLLERRRAGEPVAYLTGEREFFSLGFRVTPAVLIPRPETELLVELALERIGPEARAQVLDLATGSGCVALAIARHRPRTRVTATDCSREALDVAIENARRLHVANITFKLSDWFSALEGRKFDLIVSNPPYIADGDPHLDQGDVRFEPKRALIGGADGLGCIRHIVVHAHRHLPGGGWLFFEHGYDQGARCRRLLARAGFAGALSRADFAGTERVSGGYAVRA